MNSAASSSAEPPISPIIITACVSGSASNASRQWMNDVPGTGSPPMPTHVDTPMSLSLSSYSAGHGRLGDVAGGDADVGLTRADDAGAVGAEQLHAREVPLELVEEPGLVLG